MIYMDNSASSFYKPQCVINAVSNALSFITGNPGRSGHGMAMRGAALVLAAREKCSAFFGLKDSGGMIFTDNCSGALNLPFSAASAAADTSSPPHWSTTAF